MTTRRSDHKCSVGWAGAGRRSCHGTARQTDPGEAKSIAELYALGDCFAVGGEGHPHVTDAQWDAINALIDQTAKTVGP